MAERRTQRWRARTGLSRLVRVIAFLIPVVAAVTVAYLAARILPEPVGWLQATLWYGALLAMSFAAVAIFDRLARRLLPLATLLRLTMAFPDRAPSRFVVARNAVRTRDLEGRLERAGAGGTSGDAAEAAEMILALVASLDSHDRRTRGHSERVRVFTDLLTEELGLPEDDRDRIRWAALLHDVGKLTVAADILNKDGRPEPEEWDQIRRHPLEGRRIAAPLLPWLGEWAGAIAHHHERFDGTGYPDGLASTDISLAGRIVSVADSYETMTAARPYKKPMSVAAAKEELTACSGTHFDPTIVRAFINIGLGHLRRSAGVIAWAAGLPFSFGLERFGQGLVTIAQSAGTVVASAGTVVALAAGGIVPLPGIADEPSAPTPTPRAVIAIASPTAPPPLSPTPGAPASPSPTPEPTPAITLAPTPATSTPAPVPPLQTPTPKPAPTPKPGTTPAPTPAPTAPPSSGQLGTGYLSVWSGGNTESSPVLPFAFSVPEATSLPNYDTDRNPDPGLTLYESDKGADETNASRYQIWTIRLGSAVRFDGPASMTIWSATKDFAKGKDGRIDAFLFDCSSDSGCTRFASGSVSRAAWLTGSQTWVKDTIDFGTIDHLMLSRRYFVVKLVHTKVGGNDDDMWFAYATAKYPSKISATVRSGS